MHFVRRNLVDNALVFASLTRLRVWLTYRYAANPKWAVASKMLDALTGDVDKLRRNHISS